MASGRRHAMVPAVPFVVCLAAWLLTPGVALGADVGPGREPAPGGFADTVRVPQDEATIQEAVDSAEPGGMVLIDPGVYRESITVRTPFLTIRGMDRNRTIIDGELARAIGVHVIEADGVTIENLTSRNHVVAGFQWTSVHGFWGSYLTAYDNGDHGLSAFDSDWGQFDRSYASGSAISGFSIGRCDPCHAVITDVLAERNAVGFGGTNASGDLAIINSEWRHNTSGIVPTSSDSEELPPQRGGLIAGNFVHDNNVVLTEGGDRGNATSGIGILIEGGEANQVIGNLVENHERYGIAVMPNLDASLWVTSGNEIRENVVAASGLADLALGAPAAGSDCFSGNASRTSAPPAIELIRGCGSFGASMGGGDLAPTVNLRTQLLDTPGKETPNVGRQGQPVPPDQPSMPDPEAAPPRPAIPEQSVPQLYRVRPVGQIQGVQTTVGKEMTVFGVPLATAWWSLLIGLYGYALPGFVYAAWLTIALWDLIRLESAPISFRARWMAVVILVPFLGPLIYFAFGTSPIPKQLRLLLTVGGVGACLLIAVLAALLGS